MKERDLRSMSPNSFERNGGPMRQVIHAISPTTNGAVFVTSEKTKLYGRRFTVRVLDRFEPDPISVIGKEGQYLTREGAMHAAGLL